MNRKTATFLVTVELDPVPGTFHTPESAQEQLLNILIHHIEHYNPKVERQLDLDEIYKKNDGYICHLATDDKLWTLCGEPWQYWQVPEGRADDALPGPYKQPRPHIDVVRLCDKCNAILAKGLG